MYLFISDSLTAVDIKLKTRNKSVQNTQMVDIRMRRNGKAKVTLPSISADRRITRSPVQPPVQKSADVDAICDWLKGTK